MTLTWYRHFKRNGGLNQILRRQTSRSHYGSKVPAVTVTIFKYRNQIGKIVVIKFNMCILQREITTVTDVFEKI
jgi:hypothetical protein